MIITVLALSISVQILAVTFALRLIPITGNTKCWLALAAAIALMAARLARRFGISGSDLVNVRRGALLHDIGKMGIPVSILHKPGELSAEEWTEMHKHPRYAYEMLSGAEYLRPALDIPYCHHEK